MGSGYGRRNGAGCGRLNAEKHAQQRTLATAVWTEQGNPITGMNGECDVLKNYRGVAVATVEFRHAAEFEHPCHAYLSRMTSGESKSGATSIRFERTPADRRISSCCCNALTSTSPILVNGMSGVAAATAGGMLV